MNTQQNPTDSGRVGDLVLPFVTTPILSVMSDVRGQTLGQPRVSTLIYADAAGCSELIANGLSLLARSSTVIRTPLDAVVGLQEPTTAVDAVFASLQDDRSNIAALFDFLKDEYPRVRRIAFAQHRPPNECVLLVPLCHQDMILWDPWDRADFIEILKDALDCRLSRTRSSWTDLRLFEALQGADRLAIAEIVKRYRYRIVRLVLDATPDTMDTEDMVQNAYLAIVEALPEFNRACSPGYWIDRVTRGSIRSFFHGERHQTSSRAGLHERS